MLDREELINNLEEDIKKIEKKIKHPKLYNIGIKSKKFIIGTGIMISLSLPYAAGITGAIYSTHALNMSIVNDDLVPTCAKVGNITTSNGYFLEERVFGENLKIRNTLKISTPWEKNNDNQYVRQETVLDITNLDLSNPEYYLSMDIDELKDKVRSVGENTIVKERLDEKDKMYDEDLIEVDYCYIDKNDVRELVESDARQVGSLFLFVLLVVGYSSVLKGGVKLVFKKLPSDRLKEKKNKYVYMTVKDIEELKEIYMVKKNNIELLTNDSVDGPILRMMK